MPMQMGFRWYGEGNDNIKLSDIKQIPGLRLVQLPLHPVLHLAAEEQINLIKIVVMHLHIRELLIPVVEYFVVCPPHTLPGVE